MNLNLKCALVARGVPGYRTAQEADIHYTRLSKFISGLAQPTPEEKQKLASLLNKSEDELFPEKVRAAEWVDLSI